MKRELKVAVASDIARRTEPESHEERIESSTSSLASQSLSVPLNLMKRELKVGSTLKALT